MDYETLYKDYSALEKSLKDKLKTLNKLQKSIAREMESGDVLRALSDTASLDQVSAETEAVVDQAHTLLASLAAHEYLESGLFAQQLLEQCALKGVDVIGTFPVFEMFPFTVRIDVENLEVYLDRKKVSCLRPEALVDLIKTGQEKLYKASFNATQFANELAVAYDLAGMKQGKGTSNDIYLTTLYKFLVPMSRSRKEYDQQSFAFDIARLFDTDAVEIKGGRSYQFGPSRNSNKCLRILDRSGREHFLATIRFY